MTLEPSPQQRCSPYRQGHANPCYKCRTCRLRCAIATSAKTITENCNVGFHWRTPSRSRPCAPRPGLFNGRRHWSPFRQVLVRPSPSPMLLPCLGGCAPGKTRPGRFGHCAACAPASPRQQTPVARRGFCYRDVSMIRRGRALLAGAPISRWQLRVAA